MMTALGELTGSILGLIFFIWLISLAFKSDKGKNKIVKEKPQPFFLKVGKTEKIIFLILVVILILTILLTKFNLI